MDTRRYPDRLREKAAALDQRIEELEKLIRSSVTDGTRLYWMAEIDRLRERRRALLGLLHQDLTHMKLDLLGR